LKTFLPEPLKVLLDFQSLKAEQTTFVTPELQEVFADALFSVHLKGAGNDPPCLISILLEHKSYSDEQAPFQVLLYLAHGYQAQWKKRGEPLRPIIPFLYYHGKDHWTPKPLSSFFAPAYSELLGYIPQFEMVFKDLHSLGEEEILAAANVWLRASLLAQKYSHAPETLSNKAQLILDTLAQTTGGNLLKEVIVYIVSITKIPARQWAEMVKALPAAIKEEVMSTYDMILQEGIEQGIQKGIEQGIQQGLQQGKEKNVNEVVLRGYRNGVSFEILCLLTGLSEEEVKAIIAQHGVEEKNG
jgi:predicted transposase/invertase (TIGR01784 family)